MKAIALARILLDVPHVQVDWTVHGPKLAQVALTFGADDVDNVSALDEVAEARRRAPLEEIRRIPRSLARPGRTRRAIRGAGVARWCAWAVSPLNARPLVWSLDAHGDRFNVRFDLPSRCASLLHAGDIDVGLIPSIE